ncbi:hypothetical protein BN946_scf184491.g4 [Trametes cinnabarina]|uniref:Cytochrome P450 n=1 Tax=Pycnoporus cinnabarinus TaxID=5643 RepID=A0A060T164_PYCCI|nr:hypothetical protein BN946_scf184491.g4 [Trametes cinnabarina]
MSTRLLGQDLQIPEGLDLDEFVKNCCGVVYSAGADTTAAALRNFTLAMMVYPDVQRKAQEELDHVVGRDRLPTFDDRARLSYTSKIMKESLRWKAVSPLGVPHATLDEDEYHGASIPSGTTVLANIICPGRFFAEDSLFLTIASMLHIFSIAPPEGASAEDILRGVKWSSGLVSHPTTFPLKLTPRFEGAPSIVHAAQSTI